MASIHPINVTDERPLDLRDRARLTLARDAVAKMLALYSDRQWHLCSPEERRMHKDRAFTILSIFAESSGKDELRRELNELPTPGGAK